MKQLGLHFDVPRFPAEAANDLIFRSNVSKSIRCSTRLGKLIEGIQDEDRQRLLEPTSLPKVLRGKNPYRRPQTAIISVAAREAYERRIAGEMVDVDAVARRFFRRHERKLERLAHKLRFR
jgi:hypothetical protein